jgi:SAM-dependent methyltransferase
VLTNATKENLVDTVRSRFHSQIKNFHLAPDDWRRLQYAFGLAAGRSVLDVGSGHGALLHLLSDSGRFEKVTGFDIRTHSQAILRTDVSYLQGSIADAKLTLPAHDTVFCMEVIEHVESRFNDIMLRNLRSAASSRLVVTVPFEETEPVWWHDKPGGHRQRFSLAQLQALFPTALAAIFPRAGTDWIFLVEDTQLQRSALEVVDADVLAKLLVRSE